MAKYETLVNEILKNIGGKENIISLTHCVTRLRFNLKDDNLANDNVLKNMEGVVTVMKTAGQYQVVIGNHVPDVYSEVLKQTEMSGDEIVENKKNMSIVDKGIDILSGIMLPSIGILSAAGIIKGLLAMATAFGIMSPGEGNGWYQLLYATGDAMFYFFPVVLGYNAARKFKMNPYLGLILGAILCYPTINGVALSFFGKTLTLTYTGTVLPIIFLIAVAAPFERWLNKVIPDVIKTFIVPVIVMVVMIPLGYLIIGPVANMISALLALIVNSVYGISPLLAGALLGFFWQILVIFGVHMVVLIPSILNLMAGTPDPILPLVSAASFAQTGIVFGIWLKTKDTKLKSIAFPAWISGIFGVTEPAIYGVTLPRKKWFILSCVIASIGGAMTGALNVLKYQMSGLGIFSFPGQVAPDGSLYSFTWDIIICLAATVIAAIITIILYKDKEVAIEAEESQPTKQTEDILSPLNGRIVPLNTIEDEAFAGGLLGRGIAIDPTDGIVYAPFDATVAMLFPTKHAIGLISDGGCELLIHIGMNTVELEGQYFESFVEQGDRVKRGDKLIIFDIDKIKAAGYSVITPVVVTNSKDYIEVDAIAENEVNAENEIIIVRV